MDASDGHPAGLDERRLLAQCRRAFGRASGPGGQHRNKVETAVRLVHEPTGLVAQASERRSREQNHRVAVRRLRVRLAIEHRLAPQTHAGPSAAWASRCRSGRLAVNASHTDFPALLAEALDAVWSCDLSVADAAARLGVSTSQLIKLLTKEPAALAHLNAARQQQGLSRIRP